MDPIHADLPEIPQDPSQGKGHRIVWGHSFRGQLPDESRSKSKKLGARFCAIASFGLAFASSKFSNWYSKMVSEEKVDEQTDCPTEEERDISTLVAAELLEDHVALPGQPEGRTETNLESHPVTSQEMVPNPELRKKNVEAILDSFEKKMGALQRELGISDAEQPYEERKRRIEAQCDFLDTLVKEKRFLKELADSECTDVQKKRKSDVLAAFKKMKRELGVYTLFSEFKKNILSAGGPEDAVSDDNFEILTARFETYLSELGISLSKADLPALLSNVPEYRRIRDCMRRKLFQEERLAAPMVEFMKDKQWKWMSGSQSHALPLIFKRQLSGQGPSLVPSGILLRHHIAPLCGELNFGVTPGIVGTNNEHLSGVGFPHLRQAMRYAETKSFGFDQQLEKDKIKKAEEEMLHPPSASRRFSWLIPSSIRKFHISCLRLLQMNGFSQEEKDHIKNFLNDYKKQLEQFCPSDKIEECKTMVDETLLVLSSAQPLPLTSSERTFIEQPFSMLWGSYTAESQPLVGSIQGERLLHGPQLLGRDIQVLFVPGKYQEEVCEYTKHVRGLRVVPFETLSYLHTEGCTFNGHIVSYKGE